MIFIDTNYFLRFLLNDIETEYKTAKQVFREAAERNIKLCTSVLVFFELYWVLKSFYKKEKNEIIAILNSVLQMKFIEFDKGPQLEKAIKLFKNQPIELQDAFNIIFAREHSAEDFKTFDKKLHKFFYADIVSDNNIVIGEKQRRYKIKTKKKQKSQRIAC